MNKKKSFICFLITVLVFTLGSAGAVFADEISDKQSELEDIKNEKESVNMEMDELTASIKDQQAEVDKIAASIEKKQAEITEAEADIENTKREIEERRTGLNGRLRTMYKKGSVGYLDVLLGSNNLSEFLTNIDMIQRIYKNDQEMLATLKEQHRILEDKQAKLKVEREELSEEKSKAEEKKSALQEDKNVLQSKLEQLNADADRISDEIASLQNPEVEYTGETFIWPTTSTLITSPFGFRVHPITGIYTGHTGVDIGVGTGSPIYAAASGTVILSQWYGGYGNAVVIDHGGGISTLYGHNNSLAVSVGQHVNQGQVIASSGSTGMSTGPHLHFEVRVNGTYVDPMSYFN